MAITCQERYCRTERNCLPFGDEEDSLELELTLDGEVLDGEVLFPVVGQALVERGVLLGSNVGGVASPDGLGLVELLVLGGLLLNLLGLLGLLLVLILDLFDLVLLAGDLLIVLDLLHSASVSDISKLKYTNPYLLDLLGHNELDGVGDELGVLLDDLLDLLLLKVLELVLLEEETELGATAERGVDGVGSDGEGAAGSGLPDVLLVVVVLGDELDTLGDEVGGVETWNRIGVRRNATLSKIGAECYRRPVDSPTPN